MEWKTIMGITKIRILSSRNRRLKRVFAPSLSSSTSTAYNASELNKLGALVGLSENDVRSSTEHYKGAFGRFCSRMLLVIVVGFFVLIMLSIAASGSGWSLFEAFQEAPTTTYTPGTRYGSISPADFRDVS